MKKTLLLVSASLIVFSLSAQITNIRVGGGVTNSAIRNTETRIESSRPPRVSTQLGSGMYVSSVTVTEKFESQPGFNFKFSFDYKISPRFFLTSGLNVAYTRYKRSIELNDVDYFDFDSPYQTGQPISSFYGFFINDNDLTPRIPPTGDKSKIGQTSHVAVQIPILAGTTFFKNKLGVRAGLVTSFTLYASTYESNLREIKRNNISDKMTPVSAGGTVQLDYRVSRLISVDVSGQHFFTPLYKENYRAAGKAKMSLVSAGVSFKIR